MLIVRAQLLEQFRQILGAETRSHGLDHVRARMAAELLDQFVIALDLAAR